MSDIALRDREGKAGAVVGDSVLEIDGESEGLFEVGLKVGVFWVEVVVVDDVVDIVVVVDVVVVKSSAERSFNHPGVVGSVDVEGVSLVVVVVVVSACDELVVVVLVAADSVTCTCGICFVGSVVNISLDTSSVSSCSTEDKSERVPFSCSCGCST